VGSNKPVAVDIRLIAATNRNLEQLVQEGKFREELYWRIKVVTIQLPPLRDRADDIPLLLDYYLRLFAEEHHKAVSGFTPAARKLPCSYRWPGNILELRNVIENVVVMSRNRLIEPEDLPDVLSPSTSHNINLPLGLSLDEAERHYIFATLQNVQGNKSKAAKMLRISKKTIYRKLELNHASEEEKAGNDE